MKIIVSAIALAFATTAAAQTAPTPQPQTQDHQSHGPMHHGQQGQMEHGQDRPDHAGLHEGHGAMADCCADRNGNGRMDCCEGMEPGDVRHGQPPAQPEAPQPQSHQNH